MEAVKQFFTYLDIERNFRPATIKHYKHDLNIFQRFIDKKNKNIFSLDKTDIREFLFYIKTERKNSTGALIRKLSTLKSFFNFAQKEGYVTQSPLDQIQTPKEEKKLPVWLNEKEINKIINKALSRSYNLRGKRNYTMLLVFLSTGLRISELTRLSLRNLEYNNKEITLKIDGKGGKERFVPVLGKAKDVLDSWLRERPSCDCEYVFINTASLKLLTNRAVQKIIKNLAYEAGIKKQVTPHKLRHSFATNLLRNNANIVSIQELLGHESLNTTRIYTHITNEDKRKAMMKLSYN